MEAYLDNKSNVLNANIRSCHDDSKLYSIKSTSSFWGPQLTVLKDENPPPGQDKNAVIGAIHWKTKNKEKIIEVNGVKKSCEKVRRREKGLISRTQFWKWADDRKEYKLAYHREKWEAFMNDMYVAATFQVPERPMLFAKSKPGTFNIDRIALEADEVFLLLVFIYLEAKRQEKANASTPA